MVRFSARCYGPQPMEERTFDGVDQPLAGYVWRPSGSPKAALQIAHGMAEHAKRYDHVARAFTDAGYLVFAHDHRGHGGSIQTTPGDMGSDDTWNKAVRELHLVNRAMADETELPIAMLAHSMGSFMAQQLLWQFPEDVFAMALSGSNGKPPAIAAAGRVVTRIERLRLGGHRPSALLQKLSFGDFNKGFEGRTEFDWLSRDPAEVDAYVGDPLCGFALSVQSWLDMLDALGALTAPANVSRILVDLPIYAFAGDRDPVSAGGEGVTRLVETYRAAGLTNVEIRLYPGGRHETLNETNRDEVIADLLRWVEASFSARA